MVLQGVEVPADKLDQRGSRGGYQGVRWAIVPMSRVMPVEGRALGNAALLRDT